jgi:MFS family permease
MGRMRRLLALACAIVLVDTVFYAALVPLVPYYSGVLDLSKSEVGVLSGAFGAGVLLGAVPSGYLAVRVGVRAAALSGLALMTLSTLIFGFAEVSWVLVAARLVGGFGSALSWVAALTWLVAGAPDERRGEVLGVMVSAAVFGALLGPVLGSVAAVVGVVPAFSTVAAMGALIFAWAALEPAPRLPEPRPHPRVLSAVLRPQLATGLWFIALSPLLFSVLAVLVPLELSRLGWGAAAVGAAFLASAAFEGVVHPLLGRWSDRSGYRPPVTAGLLASVGILLVLPWVGNPWLLAFLVVLAAGAFNAPLVPGTALFSRGTEKAGMDQAVAFGATNFAWASGYAVGAPLGGFLADLRGDALSYLSLTVVCLATLFLLRRSSAVSDQPSAKA